MNSVILHSNEVILKEITGKNRKYDDDDKYIHDYYNKS